MNASKGSVVDFAFLKEELKKNLIKTVYCLYLDRQDSKTGAICFLDTYIATVVYYIYMHNYH